MKKDQTTFENFGVNIPKVKKKRVVKPTEPSPVLPVQSVEEEVDYEAEKRKKLAEYHLCYGSTWVYKVGDKVLGTGDLRYYEDPMQGKNLMVRDIFHNFFVLRKMLLASKNLIVGKDYDAGLYQYKSTKKEVMKKLQQDVNDGHAVYEITEDKIIDFPIVAEGNMIVEWTS